MNSANPISHSSDCLFTTAHISSGSGIAELPLRSARFTPPVLNYWVFMAIIPPAPELCCGLSLEEAPSSSS